MQEFLFKTQLSHYVDATLSIDWPWSRYLIAVVVIAIVVYLVGEFLSANRVADDFRTLFRWLLRTALFSLLLLVFLNPTLRFEATEAAPARLAVLLDDSLSMSITDGKDGASRGELLDREFDIESGETSNTLKEKFEIEHHRFSDSTARMQAQQRLTFDGASSNTADALKSFVSKGVTAIVLVTDGGSSGTRMEQTLNALVAADIKVFTVGVGQKQFDTELDIVSIDIPQSVLTDDTVIAEIEFQHHGIDDGARGGDGAMNIIVEQDGVIFKEHPIALDPSQTSTRASIPLTFEDAGPRQLSFRLADVDGELIKNNNVIERSINVTDSTFRVLHFEGEPRFEVKFLRRALTDDFNIQLTSLIRTADNKFFRVGLQDRDELAQGFPVERAELYRFDAVVLGSVNRSLMTDQQLELLRDFVAIRGGGLIALGGANAYSSGGYANSVLEDLLPVEFNQGQSSTLTRVSVVPSAMGLHSDLLTDIVDNDSVSAAADTDTGDESDTESDAEVTVEAGRNADNWQRLPRLTMVNPIVRAKKGATVLLEGVDENKDRYVVMARHRYGHGTVIALPVRDSWRWQINASIEPDDTTHESLWRRLLRSLVTAAQPQMEVTAASSTAVIGDTLELNIDTRDEGFRARDADGDVELLVTSPSGVVERLTASAVSGEAGRYRASVAARESGRYDFRIVADPSATDATSDGADAATTGASRLAQTHVDVTREGDEFRAAQRDESLLRHIAERTGGAYFDIDELSELADSIDASAQQRSVTRALSLADAPILLGLLLLLVVAELLLRRRRQLA